jgi:hypothetical protein
MALGFRPGLFGTENNDWHSAPPSLLVPERTFKIKISTLPWIEPETAACSESATAPKRRRCLKWSPKQHLEDNYKVLRHEERI